MAQVNKIIARYPAERTKSALIPLLHLAQAEFEGWLSPEVMDYAALILSIKPIEVYEVATFYLMYNLQPVGKYHLQVCTTTPCMLRGSDEIVDACKKISGVKSFGESSEDGLFTMTEVECLGGCVNAPIVAINDRFHEDLTSEDLGAIMDKLAKGEKVTPGSARGRQTSAPEGGPKTLTDPALYDGSLAQPVTLPNKPAPAS